MTEVVNQRNENRQANDKELTARLEVGTEFQHDVGQKLVGTPEPASNECGNNSRELGKKAAYAIFKISVPDNYGVQTRSTSCPESCREERGCPDNIGCWEDNSSS